MSKDEVLHRRKCKSQAMKNESFNLHQRTKSASLESSKKPFFNSHQRTKSASLESLKYTYREERLNFYTHLVALVLALIGSVVMLHKAFLTNESTYIFVYSLFSVTLICVFASSCFYHFVQDEKIKLIARKLDHISIYFFIAVINTALVLLAVQNLLGLIIGIASWIICILGVIQNLKNNSKKRIQLSLYILACIIFLPLFFFLNKTTLIFLLIAGLLNSIGLIFYVKKNKEFTHTIWHIFSFAACIFDYLAVFYAGQLV